MDDMHPFEQQVAAEVAREMRPSRPVDAVAVIAAVDAVRSPRWRFQSMFSATKFVLAGAIVALFGGLLLAGVLPPSSERMAAPAAVGSGDQATSTDPAPSASPEATLEPFESTARLVVDAGPDPTDQDLAVAEAAAVRYAEQAESTAVAGAVIEKQQHDDSPEPLLERISTSTDALLLSISVRDGDPQTARAVADALGNEMVRRVPDSLITDEAKAAIARNEASIRTLTNRLQFLRRKQPKRAADRQEIIALTGQIGALQRDSQIIREAVSNRLTWFERPSVPELPVQDEGPEDAFSEPEPTTGLGADTSTITPEAVAAAE